MAVVTPAYQAPATWSATLSSALGSALKADWNAADHGTARMTDDGAGLISSWTDAAGSLAVTAATTARATWSATACANHDGLTFDGVANAYVTTTLTSLPTGANGSEEFFLGNFSSTATTIVAVSYGGTTAGTRRYLRKSTGNLLQVGDATTNLASLRTIADGIHLFQGAWFGTSETGRIDGRSLATPSAAIGSLNSGTTRLRLGSDNSSAASNFLAGVACRFVITSTLTDAQDQQVDAILLWSAGLQAQLPWNHPYRWRRP